MKARGLGEIDRGFKVRVLGQHQLQFPIRVHPEPPQAHGGHQLVQPAFKKPLTRWVLGFFRVLA